MDVNLPCLCVSATLIKSDGNNYFQNNTLLIGLAIRNIVGKVYDSNIFQLLESKRFEIA